MTKSIIKENKVCNLKKIIQNKLTFFKLLLTVAYVFSVMACEDTGHVEASFSKQNIVGIDTYLYLRCNATSWNVDDISRFQTTDNPYIFSLEYEVTQDWMVLGFDHCMLTETDQFNGWGTFQRNYVPRDQQSLMTPASGMLTEGNSFSVRYPSLGRYKIFVNMRNGIYSIESADLPIAQYEWRGLAVIADFADRVLEDYEGSGIRNESDLREQLDKMEAHWSWLSRNKERIEWDIVRITLPVNFSSQSYQGWPEYRTAVVEQVKQNVPMADYDADQDGNYDALWIIASIGNHEYDYAIGGASRNNDALVFVDGQGSLSIQLGATGNFNHELGHLRGLPDLYGDNGTICFLSLMHDSWAILPNDFSAYDRVKLGWAHPITINASQSGIVLASANSEFATVKVPTVREYEYFLIEYRITPLEGYGSSALSIDGLAVYHVLEGSHQNQDPPLLRLVSADGSLSAGNCPTANDFLYPGHPNHNSPFVLRSYYGNEEIFRIQNLTRVAGEMQFDIIISEQSQPGDLNLLVNGSAELGGTNPEGWASGGWMSWEGAFFWSDQEFYSGSRSLGLTAETNNDIYWQQTVNNLIIGQAYALCGWIKADNLQGTQGGIGVNLSVQWTDDQGQNQSHAQGKGLGTYDFTKICTIFQAEQTQKSIQCRIGHWGQTVTGTGYCDELTLEMLGSAW